MVQLKYIGDAGRSYPTLNVSDLNPGQIVDFEDDRLPSDVELRWAATDKPASAPAAQPPASTLDTADENGTA